MLLLANLGLLDHGSVWILATRFWPVLIILAGLMVMVRGTFGWFIVALLVLAIVLGMVGAFLTVPWGAGRPVGPLMHWAHHPPEGTPPPDLLQVGVRLGTATLRLHPDVEGIYRVSIAHRGPVPFRVTYEVVDGRGMLTLLDPDGGEPRPLRNAKFAPEVDLAVRAGLPLQLGIACDVGSLDLDLSAHDLRALDLDLDVGAINVRLGRPTATVRVEVTSGVGGVHLRVPRDVPVRVVAETGVGSRQLDVQRTGDDWVDPGFEAATERYEIRITAGVGGIRLSRY
jgi:hypothetical protein